MEGKMSIQFYPVQKNVLCCADYTVKVNGRAVETDVARVSAHPFNRRWPGHQRELGQTELIQFLSMATDEPLEFEITPKEPFEQVAIRPRSLEITPAVENGTIRFTLDRPAFVTVEPYGRNRALHLFVDPLQTELPDPADANVLYYGAGEHNVGWIELNSNQTLFLDAGAVVYGCVRAMDAENIRICGRGILDNSKNKETILFEENAEGNQMAINNVVREHTVQLEYCTNVEIDGITIRDSLVYNIRPIGCKNLHIANVKIIGCWRYNSDGIDMHNCENVLIENCFLRTFDDSICVKGFDCYYDGDVEAAVRAAMYRNGKAYDIFKNVRVRRCTIWNDWGKCLEIGAETRAEEIFDVVFEDCDLIHVSGRPLDCCNVDYADVHDIFYRDIRVEYDDVLPALLIQLKDGEIYQNPNPEYAPNLISVKTAYHPEYSAGGTRRGRSRDIRFENIRLYGKHPPKCDFKGYDASHKTENITIENVYWNDLLLDELSIEQEAYAENVRYIKNI